MDEDSLVRIGTAGWSIPRAARDEFPTQGSQLERYATRLACVEINSSFYRPHRPQTYERWRLSAPAGFRFAVKAPRAITHEARLKDTGPALTRFLDEIQALGPALGPVLLQLPPSLGFEAARVEDFLRPFRAAFQGLAVLEPRHPSWFGEAAERLLEGYGVGRVGADPAILPQAAFPSDGSALRYWRLHGSPRKYYSEYGEARLRDYCARLRPGDWCVFDNTAEGAALVDALRLQGLVSSGGAAIRPGSALK